MQEIREQHYVEACTVINIECAAGIRVVSITHACVRGILFRNFEHRRPIDGERLSRNIAESGVSACLLSCLVNNPMMVRKSQRMRVPRSEAPQRSAISFAEVLPSPMAVKSSSSTAVLIA